jgi:hypothetical protein
MIHIDESLEILISVKKRVAKLIFLCVPRNGGIAIAIFMFFVG